MAITPPALHHNIPAIMVFVSNSVLRAAINFTQITTFFCYLQVLGKGNNTFFHCKPGCQAGGSKAGFQYRGIRGCFGVQIWIWSALMEWPESYTTPPLDRNETSGAFISVQGWLRASSRSACNLSSLRGGDEGGKEGRTPVWVVYTLVLTEHSCFSFTLGLLR